MEKTKKIVAIFMAISLVLGLGVIPSSVYAQDSEEQLVTEYPVTIEDTMDREVVLDHEPQKVVSLGPNMTELVFALGAGDRLVGRTKYCDYPEEVLEVEVIGTLQDPNFELIAELNPDLVLASTHVSEESLTQLEELGIPVVMLYDSENLAGLETIIEKLGQILNLNKAAAELADNVFGRIKRIESLTEDFASMTVYYLVGFGEYGEHTAGGNTFISDIIEAAGGLNAAGDLEGWSYSLEELLEVDPDVILIPAWAEESFGQEEPYSELTAVKEERVFVIDENTFSRQGARNAEAVEDLYSILFDLDLETNPQLTDYPYVFVDTVDREVEITDEPKTVVSLGPNMTELVFALGAGDRLVGRTQYCDYPEEALDIPVVGTLQEPNFELIAELDPDLVLVSTHASEETLEQLEELDIPVIMLYDSEHFEYLHPLISDLGKILNVSHDARVLSKDILDRTIAVEKTVYGLYKPSIYYVVGFGEYGEFTAGGDTFMSQIIEKAGGINAARDLEGWSYSLEELLEADPDIILIPDWAEDSFGQEEPYSELTAVKEGRVFVVDDNIFSRQGPRNADALETVAEIVQDLQEHFVEQVELKPAA